MAAERELKFITEGRWPTAAALAQALGAVGVELGRGAQLCQRDRYYDTPTRALARAGVALRQRWVDGRCWATLKTQGERSGALHAREELELPMAERWPPPIAARLAPLVAVGELVPLLELVTERHSYPLARAGRPLATLCLDRVEARAAEGKPARFCELELELAPAASAAELAPAVAALSGFLPLALSELTKLERAAQLLDCTHKEEHG